MSASLCPWTQASKALWTTGVQLGVTDTSHQPRACLPAAVSEERTKVLVTLKDIPLRKQGAERGDPAKPWWSFSCIWDSAQPSRSSAGMTLRGGAWGKEKSVYLQSSLLSSCEGPWAQSFPVLPPPFLALPEGEYQAACLLGRQLAETVPPPQGIGWVGQRQCGLPPIGLSTVGVGSPWLCLRTLAQQGLPSPGCCLLPVPSSLRVLWSCPLPPTIYLVTDSVQWPWSLVSAARRWAQLPL